MLGLGRFFPYPSLRSGKVILANCLQNLACGSEILQRAGEDQEIINFEIIFLGHKSLVVECLLDLFLGHKLPVVECLLDLMLEPVA